MTAGRLILRAAVGGIMAGHGLQKLTGAFGGHGLEGTEKGFEAMGLHPARQQALAAAVTETVGGGLTALGLFSPLGPAMITGTMAVAIQKVHGKNGLWVTSGGYEYNLTLIAASLALAAEGPGWASLDALFGNRRSGLRWAILAAALGFGGAAATSAIADRMKPAEDPTAADLTQVGDPATDAS